jgi:hypothetical protein
LIKNTNTRCAFVSTNSITQGEQVAPLWGALMERYGVQINFAHRTFRWDSEASIKAHVHCVIIGFSVSPTGKEKYIYDGNVRKSVISINPYLIDAPSICISSRSKPLCDVEPMLLGNKPADGGNLVLSKEEKNEILKREPELEKYIRRYVGAEEFINNKERYCLWLKNATPSDLKKSKELCQRLEAVRNMRLNSTAAPTREKAKTPHLFFYISQPDEDYLIIPSTSSERREYIPIGYSTPDVIASNLVSIVSGVSLYHFGVLTSSVHMAWMRTIAGRLKSDYRYTGSVVYNTFPWPSPTEEQKAKIAQTANSILDARSLYPDSSLADLYDPLTMPIELHKAHEANDKTVMKAYGFSLDLEESDIVAELMKMYQKLQ